MNKISYAMCLIFLILVSYEKSILILYKNSHICTYKMFLNFILFQTTFITFHIKIMASGFSFYVYYMMHDNFMKKMHEIKNLE